MKTPFEEYQEPASDEEPPDYHQDGLRDDDDLHQELPSPHHAERNSSPRRHSPPAAEPQQQLGGSNEDVPSFRDVSTIIANREVLPYCSTKNSGHGDMPYLQSSSCSNDSSSLDVSPPRHLSGTQKQKILQIIEATLKILHDDDDDDDSDIMQECPP